MPSVTRRNQVLKELDRVYNEFSAYMLAPLKSVTNLPALATDFMLKYPKLADHIKRGIKDHFTTVGKATDQSTKPEFKNQLNILRDQATLAQTEVDVDKIFVQVQRIREDLLQWRADNV